MIIIIDNFRETESQTLGSLVYKRRKQPMGWGQWGEVNGVGSMVCCPQLLAHKDSVFNLLYD